MNFERPNRRRESHARLGVKRERAHASEIIHRGSLRHIMPS